MRNRIACFFIVLLVSLLTENVFSQKEIFPILKFKAKTNTNTYVFYDSPVLKTLRFNVENLTPEIKATWDEIVNKSNLVEKINITGEEGGMKTGEFIFKKETDILSFRSFLEELKIEYFYVNNNKVLTKTLIPLSEVHDKAGSFKFKDFTFTTACNDSTKIDYYDFQIYYAGTKLQYMWSSGNYIKYLFEGAIAKYTELLDKFTVKREQFLNKSDNK